MKVDIKGVHYELTDITKNFLQDKLDKIEYASEYVTELHFALTKGTNNDWKTEVKATFKWGDTAFLDESGFNLHETITKVIDRLDKKITKEKEKIQNHHKDKDKDKDHFKE